VISRRVLLVGGAAMSLGSAGVGSADDVLFATLDAVGPLLADVFHPGRALAAMQALLQLAPADRMAALRRYLAARSAPPAGLFAVVRALVEVPTRSSQARSWPGVLQPGYLRPPALGAPWPAQPEDLSQLPHWPVILLSDVPLVEVRGYTLGGLPEPLSMHLDGLADATWRTAPLAPASAGELRYLLVHWGRWAEQPETMALLEGQLQRLEKGLR
jgi:hypothetical protein